MNGVRGSEGVMGANGTDGVKGDMGTAGSMGRNGTDGEPGPKGPKGMDVSCRKISCEVYLLDKLTKLWSIAIQLCINGTEHFH